MNKLLCASLFCLLLFAGCATKPPPQPKGPPPKAILGKLELTTTILDNGDVELALIYVDNVLIGSVKKPKQMLFLPLGAHALRIELAGFKTYQQNIQILGDPNIQTLRVLLEK